MKEILQIAINDVRLFLKDKSGYGWLFLAPLGFIYFTGVPSNGPKSAPSNPRPSVVIENRDTGFMGALLMEEMNAQGMRVLDTQSNEKADRRIVIPDNLTDKILAEERVKLNYFKMEGSGDESAVMIEMRLLQATLAINANLVQWATHRTDDQALTESALRAIMDEEDPVQLEASFAGRNPIPSGFKQSLPGNLVMFIMMNILIFGGTSVASERKNGVLRRLAALPISRWQIVTGKITGRFLLGCILIAFFFFAGRFLFGVNIATSPIATILVLGLFAWLAASLGVLIGSVTSNPDKTIGLCVMLSMLMGALGGCWWPLEVTSESMQLFGHLFPTAWAMDALHQLISFGGGLADVQTEITVLAGFAITANLLAARFLKYSEA
ncbi:ABC transporter permease [bacterium]|jgi:ABC-2 type transport system permease protein|nr:ABC transporter permease [bacterium]MDB4746270.1 ABC transporter permease [Verrucomicrobiota bacterium]